MIVSISYTAEQLTVIPISPWKRVFDIVLGSVIIVVLSPIMALIFLIIYIEKLLRPTARGPLLYKETRISQGEPFNFYKIRTFKLSAINTAHQNGTIHTKELERRWRNLTFAGLILRQIYLDEFPQLFIVLSGKMSLVGPRPVNPDEYAKSLAGGYHAKAVIKAGLTGRFQSHKHIKYKLNQESVDMDYALLCKNSPGWKIIAHDSFILLQTIYTIIRAEGI